MDFAAAQESPPKKGQALTGVTDDGYSEPDVPLPAVAEEEDTPNMDNPKTSEPDVPLATVAEEGLPNDGTPEMANSKTSEPDVPEVLEEAPLNEPPSPGVYEFNVFGSPIEDSDLPKPAREDKASPPAPLAPKKGPDSNRKVMKPTSKAKAIALAKAKAVAKAVAKAKTKPAKHDKTKQAKHDKTKQAKHDDKKVGKSKHVTQAQSSGSAGDHKTPTAKSKACKSPKKPGDRRKKAGKSPKKAKVEKAAKPVGTPSPKAKGTKRKRETDWVVKKMHAVAVLNCWLCCLSCRYHIHSFWINVVSKVYSAAWHAAKKEGLSNMEAKQSGIHERQKWPVCSTVC